MDKIILLLISFMFMPIAHAEYIICYDQNNYITETAKGDCMSHGYCSGFNATGVRSDCFLSTDQEYNKAQEKYIKYDPSVVSGLRIIDMNQTEIDAIDQAEAQAAKDKLIAAIENLDISSEDIIIALIKKINLRIPNNPITKQEVINQIKTDKGL